MLDMRVDGEQVNIGMAFDSRERSDGNENACTVDQAELERLARLRKRNSIYIKACVL